MKRGERKRGSGNFARTQGTASHGRFQMQAFKTTSPRSIDRTTCWVFFPEKKRRIRTKSPQKPTEFSALSPPREAPKTPNPQAEASRRRASSCSYLAAGRAARSCGSRPWLRRPRSESDRQTPLLLFPTARSRGGSSGGGA